MLALNLFLLAEIVLSIIKIIFLYQSIKFLGFLFGIIFFILINFIKKHFLNWYLNMSQMRSFDKCFISTKVAKMFNLIGIIFLDDFEEEKIKDLLIERALKKIKIMRSKLNYKYFNYYWQEVPLNLATERIKILPKMKTKEEIIEFANSEISRYIQVLKELPFEIYLIPYGDESQKKGALIIKSDHCLADGLSAVSLLCAIADNYSPEVFPLVMHSKQIPFLKKISKLIPCLSYVLLERIYIILFSFVSFPYYAPQVFYKAITKNFGNTPFKNLNESAPSYICKFKCSKLFDLKAFNSVRRKEDLNISFNELMMGAFSISIKKLCDRDPKQYGHLKEVMSLVPIGLKGIPESLDKIEINNRTNGIYLELGLISDIAKEKKILQENFSNFIKAPGVASAILSIANFMIEFLPLEIMQLIANRFFGNVDFITTNVPGPREPLFYYGSKVTEIIPVLSTTGIKTAIPVFSYNDKFRFLVSTDETAKINRDEFVAVIEQTLDEMLVS